MISRLLIANRGEIAVRIAAGASRLGIGTVGVYSVPDAGALHGDVMDLSVALPGASPQDTYLRGDAIIAAAHKTDCDAIHPGYGFLAENAAFAQAVIDAGLVWVGPTPDQIRLLGDKVAAKNAAIEAGVPTTWAREAAPGSIPDDVSMPALVKAAAGGGGRGMRIVRSSHELAASVEAASREALSAFGDGTVFIEPYIEDGRHIEVQIMGDSHGTVLHFGERECSIQRRNQKIIEESPSAGISEDVRTTLLDGALALAKHVGYLNAGTVEFLVGRDGTINFLEVNTRLQVEHPVTEAVTGLDLVALQLMVAAGDPLPLTQQDVTVEGHAIEARIVAEDPSRDWLPSSGMIRTFDISAGVRVDTGVRDGTIVAPDYDSLLAKAISHGSDRETAARILSRSLRSSRIVGVDTNLKTLTAILEDEDFLAANTPTTFLSSHPELLDPPGPKHDDLLALLLGAVFVSELRDRARDAVTGFAPSGWRNLRTIGQRQAWTHGTDLYDVEYVMKNRSEATVLLGDWPEPTSDGSLAIDERRSINVRLLERSTHQHIVEFDGLRRVIDIDLDGDRAHTRSRAGTATWTRVPRFATHEFEDVGSGPVSPLPGTVIAVHVSVGEQVEEGQLLMVVEAMKMEHRITAAVPATVAEVRFAQGDRVDTGDLLVRLDLSEQDEDIG
ncbi:MAG: biotin/lipoyl-binding protein [Acidimicrobiia bacterium]|nr:biotin/lipoyl-binding protein [Acidimicrobiia bacterium]